LLEDLGEEGVAQGAHFEVKNPCDQCAILDLQVLQERSPKDCREENLEIK